MLHAPVKTNSNHSYPYQLPHLHFRPLDDHIAFRTEQSKQRNVKMQSAALSRMSMGTHKPVAVPYSYQKHSPPWSKKAKPLIRKSIASPTGWTPNTPFCITDIEYR